jgi:hypothetical protein
VTLRQRELVGQSVCWSVGRLVARSVGRSVGRLVARSVGWSLGRSVGLSVGQSVGVSVSSGMRSAGCISQLTNLSVRHTFSELAGRRFLGDSYENVMN